MYSSRQRTQLILELTKKFNLNRLGQIKLSPFPFEALQYAKEKFDLVSKPQSLRDTFSFFLSVCTTWCEQHSVEPDWKTAYHLMEEFNLDPKGKVYNQEREIPSYKLSGHYQIQTQPKREYPKQSFSANRAFDSHAERQRTIDAIGESKESLERKIQAAYNAGDNEEVARLRRYDPDHIDWKKPNVYAAAKTFASQMPESVKKELIHSRDTDPNHVIHKYPPVLALLKEYEQSQNKNEDQI